jgi:hypothetical protein
MERSESQGKERGKQRRINLPTLLEEPLLAFENLAWEERKSVFAFLAKTARERRKIGILHVETAKNTSFAKHGVQERENTAHPERIATVHKLVCAALKAAFQPHLSSSGPLLQFGVCVCVVGGRGGECVLGTHAHTNTPGAYQHRAPRSFRASQAPRGRRKHTRHAPRFPGRLQFLLHMSGTC